MKQELTAKVCEIPKQKGIDEDKSETLAIRRTPTQTEKNLGQKQ